MSECKNWKNVSGGIIIGSLIVIIFAVISFFIFGGAYMLLTNRSIEETIDNAVKEIAVNAEEAAVKEVIKQANAKFVTIRNDIRKQVDREFRKEADKLRVKVDEFAPQIEAEVNKRITAAEGQVKDQVNREIAKIRSEIETKIDEEIKVIKEQVKVEARKTVADKLDEKLAEVGLSMKTGEKCIANVQCASGRCEKQGFLKAKRCK